MEEEIQNTFQWLPIETAPKDGTAIMGWIGVPWIFFWNEENKCWHGAVPHKDGYAMMWIRSANNNQPEYWLPLPDAPND